MDPNIYKKVQKDGLSNCSLSSMFLSRSLDLCLVGSRMKCDSLIQFRCYGDFFLFLNRFKSPNYHNEGPLNYHAKHSPLVRGGENFRGLSEVVSRALLWFFVCRSVLRPIFLPCMLNVDALPRPPLIIWRRSLSDGYLVTPVKSSQGGAIAQMTDKKEIERRIRRETERGEMN